MCACDCTICTWPCATQHSIHIYIYSRTCAPARLTVHWHTAFEILISHKRTAKHGTAQEKYAEYFRRDAVYRAKHAFTRRFAAAPYFSAVRLATACLAEFANALILIWLRLNLLLLRCIYSWLGCLLCQHGVSTPNVGRTGGYFFVLFCSFVHQNSQTKRRYHAENKKQKTTKTFSKCIVRNNDFVLCAVHHLLLFRTQKNRTKKLFFFIFFFKLNFCSIRLF